MSEKRMIERETSPPSSLRHGRKELVGIIPIAGSRNDAVRFSRGRGFLQALYGNQVVAWLCEDGLSGFSPELQARCPHFFAPVASERYGQSSNRAFSFAWVCSAETDREMNNGEQRDIQKNRSDPLT